MAMPLTSELPKGQGILKDEQILSVREMQAWMKSRFDWPGVPNPAGKAKLRMEVTLEPKGNLFTPELQRRLKEIDWSRLRGLRQQGAVGSSEEVVTAG